MAKDIDNEFAEYQNLELEYIYESITRIQDRRGYVFVFFGTAALTALAIGMQEQKAGFILFSVLFLFLYMGYEGSARAELAPFFFRGYEIEKKHKNEISILRTYLSVVEHSDVEDEFDEILKIKDYKEQAKRINRIYYHPFRIKKSTTIMATIGIVVEIIFMLLLRYVWNWSYF